MNDSNVLVVVLCAFCICGECASIDMRKKSSQTAYEGARPDCAELPEIVLAELLGEAYNSRYMSVNRPVTDDDEHAYDRNAYKVSKRKVESLPSFYVEDSIDLSEKPAWDIRGHIGNVDLQLSKRRRRKRAVSIVNDHQKIEPENALKVDYEQLNETNANPSESTIRNKRAHRRNGSQRTSDDDLRLWRCDASIKWVDLGPDYFPRFLRTVECTKQFCYYGLYECRAKKFAVKILHRRKGVCADASNLRKISSFEFRSPHGELWKWKEVAVNFCCDCVVARRVN